MKIFNYIALVALFLFAPMASFSQINKAEIRAMGLTCSMCSNAINKSLQALPNVTKVSTDLNTNTFTVFLDKQNTLTPQILKKSIENAGFSVGVMTLEVSKNELQSSNYIVLDKNKMQTKESNRIQILNKGYVTNKEFKKLSKAYKTLDTGFDNGAVYHIKLVE
jgi:copper chaperone CopZ